MTTRKAGRRSNGEGSISQRSDGKWEARITMPGGQRRSFYAATKALATAKTSSPGFTPMALKGDDMP